MCIRFQVLVIFIIKTVSFKSFKLFFPVLVQSIIRKVSPARTLDADIILHYKVRLRNCQKSPNSLSNGKLKCQTVHKVYFRWLKTYSLYIIYHFVVNLFHRLKFHMFNVYIVRWVGSCLWTNNLWTSFFLYKKNAWVFQTRDRFLYI